MKTLVIFLLMAMQSFVIVQSDLKPPTFEYFPGRQKTIVSNMTAEIIKDVYYRLQLAQRYVDMHKGSMNYELGFIASGVMERFRAMIKHYRKVLKERFHEDQNTYKTSQFQEQLLIILGYYNEILYERTQFYVIERAHQARLRAAGGTARRSAPVEGRRQYEEVTTTTTPTVDDSEYKRQLRLKKFEEQLGGFDPQREGIDIDLTDII